MPIKIYRVETKLNDGYADAPPFNVSVQTLHELADIVHSELANDEGVPFGVGTTVTITRVA